MLNLKRIRDGGTGNSSPPRDMTRAVAHIVDTGLTAATEAVHAVPTTPVWTHENIARVCHESVRVFALTLGDTSLRAWEDVEPYQREATLKGVEFHLQYPDAQPSASHEQWLSGMKSKGWEYGPEKDTLTKTHPLLVPYEELPAEHKVKDLLFAAVCKALSTQV